MSSQRNSAFSSSGRAFLLLSLFVLFLSGTSCLIYEIAWSRLLAQAFGSTLPAICTVLTVFLGGLALGAYILSGKWTDRGNPLLICSCLELLIGAYAFFVPTICRSIEFRQFVSGISAGYLAQILPIAILLAPTIFMGATLPVICRVYKGMPDKTLTLSSLAYALNTAGAVAGAALAGFVLLPTLGIQMTTFAGCAINIVAALICLLLSRTKLPEAQGDNTKKAKSNKQFSYLLCVLLGLSGVLGIVLEVVWTRYFTLIMGSTTYAFSSVLIAVLLGLAIGALLVSIALKKIEDPLTTISVAFLATSLLAYLGMVSFGSLPSWYAGTVEGLSKGQDLAFSTLLAIQFLTILVVVLPPTITNGLVFPLCLKALNTSAESTPAEVGKLYGVNSLGSIAGAWLAGFVLIPWLSNIFPSGIQATIFFVCILFFALALSAFYYCLTFKEQCGYSNDRGPDKRLLGSFVTVIVIFGYLRLPHWNEPIITSGLSINPVANADVLKAMQQPQTLGQTLYYKEGLNSVVTVTQLPQLNVNVLKNNGKAEAALPIDINSPAPTSDLSTQTLLGLLPVLFHPNKAENVLVIGFGSGETCGSMLQSSDIEYLTAVDLESAVFEASKYFESVNHKPLEDKRVRAVTADGANFLLRGAGACNAPLRSDREHATGADRSGREDTNGTEHSDREHAMASTGYDLIVSQPADPWVSGVSDLYTRELWEQAANRLNPNGIFCQWVQLYDITPQYLGVILRTFQSVFPDTYIFHQKESAEIILIGSKDPYQINEQLLIKRFNEESIRKELARIEIHKPQQIADMLALTPDEVNQLTTKIGQQTNDYRLNTSDNLLTEYQLPRLLSGKQRVCEECLHMLIK
ncbi:MAG: fused MFS/spermidine synthase [Candidatus Obscuribacterales bacterium]|nr:fused MFS/spermidine synthase [Candidatus Obscuribacterales bacterium]